ncbi:hypothetical protein IEQ34_013613 [Dendrobium chrysotoxum]|uniref:t-SNARE coiled-coil homology domain-containing protein n=1 Tax=Dendrobium chrysotoxum TaxID=161865 RepID=A0AAV7GRV3_DENCH|nr:hypothetical protein IEQ34_013613 [Dendrobium chrysotoxum]
MNNLFSSSWHRDPASPNGSIGMTRTTALASLRKAAAAGGANLDKFFHEVESIKEELKEIERAHRSLHESNESLKTLHSPTAVRDLRARMDGEVSHALKKVKLVKLKLESLDRSNASSRYYAVTGEKADESTIDAMAAADREGEGILRAAVEGRGAVEAAVAEMRERKGAVEELERNLMELHQVFLDMAVMVETQGQQLDDIESQVGRASSFVDHGVKQLHQARRHQRNTRKWTCIGLLILIIIVLIIVLPIVLKN